jgi:DNA-binding winged helix-turn-helix (wHTH) protein
MTALQKELLLSKMQELDDAIQPVPPTNPRVREIFARLESINMEEIELRNELRAILDGETNEDENPDFSMFKDETRLLLIEFYDTRDHMLWKQDIREDVIRDENASDKAVRQVIVRARKAIKEIPDFRYEIKTIRKDGYKLVPKEMLQSATSPVKHRGKAKKNM